MPIITFLSDSHGLHRKIPKEWLPKTDWIIHSGDVSNIGKVEEVADFLDWFSKLDYVVKIFIVGNHDKLFEQNSYVAKSMIPENIIYLENSGIEIDGIKIFGSPITPKFGFGWAFNADRGEEIKKYWDEIPVDTNLLITHGPAHGILDMTLEGDITGCEDLLEAMNRLKNLKLFACGHIHEARGSYRFADGKLFINSSLLNRNYKLVNKPFVVDTADWRIIS